MTTRQSHLKVAHKYSPTPDLRWTLEIEAEFFARLDEQHPSSPIGRKWTGKAIPLSPSKAALVREYATDTLHAQRLSSSYLTTLSAVMGNIASAERGHSECTISQRDDRLGPRPSLRTIQAQLEVAEVLVRISRPQGRGFVGDVFVYRPSRTYVPHDDPAGDLEASYRAGEGEADFLPCLSQVETEVVRY
jgi:hypothetical protein